MSKYKLSPGDTVILKKPHPCGGHEFGIISTENGENGNNCSGNMQSIYIVCKKCGHTMTIDRIKLEKAIKSHIVK